MTPLLPLSLGFLVLNYHGAIFSSSLMSYDHQSIRVISHNHRNIKRHPSVKITPRCTSIPISSSLISSIGDLPDTSQSLDPQTLAGTIEEGLKEKFDGKDIERVLTSWRLVDQGYYRKEYVGSKTEHQDDMIQECHSYVPGLSIKPFWDAQDFDWTRWLESSYSDIREEFDAFTATLPRSQKEGNNIWAGALTDDATSYGEGWKTLVLMDRGRWDNVNANLFPRTCQAIYKSGVPATEIFFASMDGPSSIKKHSDFTNFVLTSHLALDIPHSGENKCRLTVGNETRQWLNGKTYVFDTSLLHDAINESEQVRYILMMRVWHPDLTNVEKEALQFTFDCLEFPGLISSDSEERFKAEKIAELTRSFPLIPDEIEEKKYYAQIRSSEINAKSSGKKKQKKRKLKSTGRGFG